jgi:FkbM family methyltransferase
MTAPPPRIPIEDRIRQWIIPRRLYWWDKYRRDLRRGERELRLVPFLAHPDRVSLDIGAFKGMYSYAMMQHSRAVHAFEPNPNMYRMLEQRLGGFAGRVTTHEVALSNVSGTAELRVPNRGSGFHHPRASLSTAAVSDDYTSTTIRTARLDDLHIANVGFMKIDVEGFERQVLEGAAATIARDKPNMLIELEEEHTKLPLPEMAGFVCGLGYECLALVHGVLTTFSRFDVTRHHLAPASKHDRVNNFIFLPRNE